MKAEVTFGKMALPVLQNLLWILCVTLSLVRTQIAIDFAKVNKLIQLSEVKNVLFIDGCSNSCADGIEEIFKQNVSVTNFKNPAAFPNLPSGTIYDFILITTDNTSEVDVGNISNIQLLPNY